MAEFVVHAIEKTYGGLKLSLRKYYPPLQPEPEEPEETYDSQPDPLETIIPETDDERILLKLLKAMKKFNPSLFQPLPTYKPMRMPTMYTVHGSSEESALFLSDEEYKEIGMPGLGQRLTLTLKKVENAS